MMQKLEGKLSKIMEISQRISWFEQEVRGQNWQNLVVFHGKSEGPKVQLPPKCHRKKPQERMAFIEGLSTTIIPKNKAEK